MVYSRFGHSYEQLVVKGMTQYREPLRTTREFWKANPCGICVAGGILRIVDRLTSVCPPFDLTAPCRW